MFPVVRSKPFLEPFLGFQPCFPLAAIKASRLLWHHFIPREAGLTRCPGPAISAQHQGSSWGPRREAPGDGNQGTDTPGIRVSVPALTPWAAILARGSWRGRMVVRTTLVPGGEVDWPGSTWRPRSPSASKVPTFLGAVVQCSPEPLDLGGLSGWHVEKLAQWAGQRPRASLWSKPLLSA